MLHYLLICFTVASSHGGGAQCNPPIRTHSVAECKFFGRQYSRLNGTRFVRFQCVSVPK